MRQTLQRCTTFHFGYSKVFVPFISSGSNLHQFYTAYSLPSKRIGLFIPNFTLISGAHFRLKRNNIFPPIKSSERPYLINQITTKIFYYLYYSLGDFCSILRHNSNPLSFQCSQHVYKPLHFSFSSFQRKFIL